MENITMYAVYRAALNGHGWLTAWNRSVFWPVSKRSVRMDAVFTSDKQVLARMRRYLDKMRRKEYNKSIELRIWFIRSTQNQWQRFPITGCR